MEEHRPGSVIHPLSEEDSIVGGIAGWGARPARAQSGAAIVHVHGGWFNRGTAQAFRNLAGNTAPSGGADVFVPDYRLAPEHPFPATVRLEAIWPWCFCQVHPRWARLYSLQGSGCRVRPVIFVWAQPIQTIGWPRRSTLI
jgi:hypothetical protein